jgi:hypothetical protein
MTFFVIFWTYSLYIGNRLPYRKSAGNALSIDNKRSTNFRVKIYSEIQTTARWLNSGVSSSNKVMGDSQIGAARFFWKLKP